MLGKRDVTRVVLLALRGMPTCFGMSASRPDPKWLGVFLLVFWCLVYLRRLVVIFFFRVHKLIAITSSKKKKL